MRVRFSSLQFKVIAIVAAALFFCSAVALGALWRVHGSIGDLDRVSREDFFSQQLMLHTQVDFARSISAWHGVLVNVGDTQQRDVHWNNYVMHAKETVEHAKEARAGAPSDDVRGRLETFLAQQKDADERIRKAFDVVKKGGGMFSPEVTATNGAELLALRSLQEAENKSEELGKAAVIAAVARADAAFRVAVLAVAIAVLGAVVVLWVFMRRAVLNPMANAVSYAEQIAQGDLTADIQAKSRDETGQLLRSLSIMNVGLADVVSQVRNSAEAVVTAANQVAAGTTDLSQRTEEQASSLEETAASMEELASTVKQNADNAKQADELARTASQRAEQGGAEVVRVVTTMTEISDSAKKISDIISVIDAIAFQTNILALNAAVEAARAGEQGRGFAVVAAEVRSLAQRSAQAAKEIKDLIGASVDKVETGTQLVEQAGDTIQALVIDVKRVSTIMASIAEASSEQSRGVQQVNKTVTEMDKVVQQNAAAVQQSAAAAEGMRRQAESLVQAVSAFRIRREGVAHSVLHAATQPVERAPLRETRSEPLLARPAASKTSRVPATTGADDDWEQF
jgi:methyl-accepting chemotaxis protein